MAEGDGATAAHEGGSSAHRHESLLECKHPVFLSHSGAQKNFVRQLCLDIERHDRYPFFDKRRDSLPIGCSFPDEIFKAIEACHVAVVVLSEDFFTRSKWPMLELAALVKRKRGDSKLIIMPVFLGMTNADCRDKSNQIRWLRVWQSWAEEDSRIDLGEWRETLKMFGYTNGIFLNDGSDEIKCREEIVEAICKEVPPRTRWDDSHVQGRSHLISAFRTKLDGMEASKRYGARILGIYGVGGVGKTTICKVLCNEYFEELEGKVCHVEFGTRSKLQRLQEILKRLTNTNHELVKSFSEDECKDKMKKDLPKKVFLAIDNVYALHDIVEEAKDLLRMGFMQGSIVIVTARSRVQLSEMDFEECMEMPDMDENDARSLFLYHATPRSYLRSGDAMSEQLLTKCIKRCYFGKGDGGRYHYHPLALKVLGGQLGSDPKTWMEKLKGVDPFNQYEEEGKDHPIFSILGRSFEMLKEEDQLLFMDATLFFLERRYYNVNINIFEWLSVIHGKSVDIIKRKLEGLKSKSLVENLGDGRNDIGMHDLWRDFAIMKSDGGQLDSRLWFYKRIYCLNDPRREEPNLSSGNGWERLQRICMVSTFSNGRSLRDIDLSCYSNLRVLKLVNVYMDMQMLDVSSLRELKSFQILHPVRTNHMLEIIGLGLLRSLVYLCFEMVNIRIEHYEGDKGLTSLQVLHSMDVDSSPIFPNFSKLNSLQDVKLCGTTELDMISGLNSNMTNLKRLQLSGCSSLRKCHGVGDLVALEELILCWCSKLEELPHLGGLKHLLDLNISFCKLIEAVPGLGNLVALRKFEAHGCDRLAELPDMRKLVNLRVLNLLGCSLMKAIPGLSDVVALEHLYANCECLLGCDDLRKLVKLEIVWIEGWSAEGVPCLSDLASLKSLEIKDGESELGGFLNLIGLQELRIVSCEDTVDIPCFSSLTALISLDVVYCRNLERLPDMHRLSNLESVYILCCPSLREWGSGSGLRLFGVDLCVSGPILPHLQSMFLSDVAFAELPDLSRFPQLRELEIELCDELMSLTSSAPLTALKHLRLSECERLIALPDVNHLVSLASFELVSCGELELTADEIVQLEAMCPGLELDKSHLENTELDKDDRYRDAKRLKSVGTV